MAAYKYSVGDRVRVVWQGFVDADAKVIKVHASSAVDVLYAKTGTVGVALTAAEHILELMGDVVQVRLYLNRCSRVTCRVVQCAYARLFASHFLLSVLTLHDVQQPQF